ncbi:MAG: DUF4837 family protein [Gemmatimonadota bacterium]|nr:DUF4837 family protein [Gemmatimonadota bacterium]
MTNRLRLAILSAFVLLPLAACDEKPLGYGDANSIIAVMSAEQWEAASDEVYQHLEPRISTVREEKAFTVTYQEPLAEFWDRLRRFRQMLVVGTRSDPWVEEVLAEAREPITQNGLHQVYDVWSRGQTVTLVLLDEGWSTQDLAPYLTQVGDMLDQQFRAYAGNRMYFSGVDSALADTLAMQAGFTMYLPVVYRWQAQDSVYIFRNDNPDPAELIRQIAVTWRTPAPGQLERDEVLAWRDQLEDGYYTEPQMIVLDHSSERTFQFKGHTAYELNAQWRNPPERRWPAGGPLITRIVTCDGQDRTYIFDAWLYAPGKEKYEYMIQLETLLDTFSCET